jgi:hypothetical protein
MAAVKHGIGRHTFHVPPGDMDKAGIFIIFTLVVWCWAVTLVKVSMAMMLLRIQRTKVWQWGLGIVIAIQILAVIANTLVNFIQCHPLSATWNPRTPKATCWDPSQKASVAYILSGKC